MPFDAEQKLTSQKCYVCNQVFAYQLRGNNETKLLYTTVVFIDTYGSESHLRY